MSYYGSISSKSSGGGGGKTILAEYDNDSGSTTSMKADLTQLAKRVTKSDLDNLTPEDFANLSISYDYTDVRFVSRFSSYSYSTYYNEYILSFSSGYPQINMTISVDTTRSKCTSTGSETSDRYPPTHCSIFY